MGDIPSKSIMLHILNTMSIELSRDFIRFSILPLIVKITIQYIHTQLFDKNADQNLIIGAFGPYDPLKPQYLEIMGQKKADRGCLAVLGHGFYHPDEPRNIKLITEIHPEEVRWFLTILDKPDFIYRDYLPAIVDGATVRLEPGRTQLYELESCVDLKKPVIGYIITDNLFDDPSNCPLLLTKNNNGLISQRCTSRDRSKCLRNDSQLPKCPFYDAYDVPWIQKIWFMEEPSKILLAINSEDAIDDHLDRFIEEIKNTLN